MKTSILPPSSPTAYASWRQQAHGIKLIYLLKNKELARFPTRKKTSSGRSVGAPHPANKVG
jgi:hypothetical protein